jgi:hypothetical protein
VPEINIFKNELIQRKSPLLIKLKCNTILNVLDTASATDVEFKRLSCQMRKDLIIQDLEEILGTEIERDIKKDIKYLKRAPKISKYDYYKKKGLLYPEYQSGYFPYYPGYMPPYLSDYYGTAPSSLQKTRRRRKPITESIYRRGPVTTSAFTTQRPSTASTLDTFTSPDSLSPSRFEEKPTSKLERELEKQRYLQPYPYQYGMYPYQYQPSKLTKKQTSSKTTSPYPIPYGMGMMAPPPFQYQTPSKKIITNKTRRILKGGKKYNKTIKTNKPIKQL